MKKSLILLVAIFCIPQLLISQSRLTENTLALDESQPRQEVQIEEMAWYAQRWVGEGFGAVVEENFSPPNGGTMVGTFRMINDGAPAFYEMLLIEADGNSLVYKVKHFNPDFSGWEEKEDFVSFPLIKIEDNRYYFAGLTVERKEDGMVHYLAMKQKDGSHKEAVLTFQKVH